MKKILFLLELFIFSVVMEECGADGVVIQVEGPNDNSQGIIGGGVRSLRSAVITQYGIMPYEPAKVVPYGYYAAEVFPVDINAPDEIPVKEEKHVWFPQSSSISVPIHSGFQVGQSRKPYVGYDSYDEHPKYFDGIHDLKEVDHEEISLKNIAAQDHGRHGINRGFSENQDYARTKDGASGQFQGESGTDLIHNNGKYFNNGHYHDNSKIGSHADTSKANHNKGHSKTGFRSSYHKEESGEDSKYVDEGKSLGDYNAVDAYKGNSRDFINRGVKGGEKYGKFGSDYRSDLLHQGHEKGRGLTTDKIELYDKYGRNNNQEALNSLKLGLVENGNYLGYPIAPYGLYQKRSWFHQ